MDLLNNILDFIVGISWPAVTLIFFWKFGSLLYAFLHSTMEIMKNRGIKLGKEGFEVPGPQPFITPPGALLSTHPERAAATATATKDQQELIKDVDIDTIEEIPGSRLMHPFIKTVKDSLKDQYKNIVKDDDSKKMEMILHHLAEASVALYFERVYQIILSSQLQALVEMKMNGGMMSYLDYKKLYQRLTSQNDDLYFKSWHEFMEKANLVILNKDHVQLTKEGENFFPYLLERGYPLVKH